MWYTKNNLAPEECDFLITLALKTGEFVNALCEDGFYPGEVIDIVIDKVHVNFLTVKYCPGYVRGFGFGRIR